MRVLLGTGSISNRKLPGGRLLPPGQQLPTFYHLPYGSHVLRFEDFEVTNGLDSRVLRAESGSYAQGRVAGRRQYQPGQAEGQYGRPRLKIPTDINLDEQNSVIIIYCMPFHVIFSVASLEKVG
jgi:hypothetical protein